MRGRIVIKDKIKKNNNPLRSPSYARTKMYSKYPVTALQTRAKGPKKIADEDRSTG
jgi:hypothetical protein